MATRVRTRLTPAEGRKFAFTVGGAFLALAGLLAWRGHAAAAIGAALLACALVIAGALAPGRLGLVQGAWMTLARAISMVTTPVSMAVIYFGVMLPIGVARRRFGRNPLVRVPGAGGTYWVERPPGARRSDLRRQF